MYDVILLEIYKNNIFVHPNIIHALRKSFLISNKNDY